MGHFQTYWAGPLYCLLCSAPAPPGCHPSLVLRVLLLRVTAKGQGNGYRLQQGKLQPGARKDFTEEAGPQKVCATSVFGGVQTQPGQSPEQPEVSQPWFDQETRVAGPSCHMYPTASCTSLQKQIKFNTSVLVRLVPWDVERKNGKLAPHTSDNVDKSWALQGSMCRRRASADATRSVQTVDAGEGKHQRVTALRTSMTTAWFLTC